MTRLTHHLAILLVLVFGFVTARPVAVMAQLPFETAISPMPDHSAHMQNSDCVDHQNVNKSTSCAGVCLHHVAIDLAAAPDVASLGSAPLIFARLIRDGDGQLPRPMARPPKSVLIA